MLPYEINCPQINSLPGIVLSSSSNVDSQDNMGDFQLVIGADNIMYIIMSITPVNFMEMDINNTTLKGAGFNFTYLID